MIQTNVFFLTLILMGVVLAVFAFVAFNASRSHLDYVPVQQRAYRIRGKFFWMLLMACVLITSVTLVSLPYAATRGDLAGVNKQVDVVGKQWYWEVSDTSAEVGDTLVFNVSAADVTHGLGIYSPKMQLLGQTQAMPGYSNALRITFAEPGKYKLLCMEYCGLAHHAMVSEFTVLPKP